MKRRLIDKNNIFMISLNTWLFATGLVLVCYAWYKDYLTSKSLGFGSVQILDFTSPVTLSTIAILFGAFFFSIVIIRPDRARRIRERELMKLKMKSNQHDAYTDKETGLYNRLSFERSLGVYLSEFTKIEETVGLLILKAENINAVEPDTMVNLARVIESAARDYDVISRIDTNRFAVITPNITEGDLANISSRYAKVIGQTAEISKDLRLSIGYSATSLENKTIESLLSAADKSAQVNRRLGGRVIDSLDFSTQRSVTVETA